MRWDRSMAKFPRRMRWPLNITTEKNVAKVSSGFRVVIPKGIRERLSISAGDVVRFRTTNRGKVVLERADTGPFAVFDEWNSDEDTRLYRQR